MFRRLTPQLSVCICVTVLVSAIGGAIQGAEASREAVDQTRPAKPKDRAESVRALLSHLRVGEGAAVADIGFDHGVDVTALVLG